MQTAIAAVKKVSDPMLRRKASDLMQGPSGFLCCWREVVIKDECDARRIQDRAATELLAKNARHEVCAEVMHHHQIHTRDDHISRRDFPFAARLGKDLFNHVHGFVVPPQKSRFPLWLYSV